MLKQALDDLISLLFPEICNACAKHLYRGEEDICTQCLYDLPFTDFHQFPDNPTAKLFWGRLPIQASSSLLYFKKESKVQNLMHQLKYNNKTNLGITLGKMLGKKLNESPIFNEMNLIIPVPLHPKKLKFRGYNQSEFIVKGVAEILNIPLDTSALQRIKATDSQTRKARYHRYENMYEVFKVADEEKIKDKHVLLVDDVLTTGATLEACAGSLLHYGAEKISIATVAFAQ